MMMDVNNDKQKQINDIVSIVKLASLLFVGVILCKSLFSTDNTIMNIKIDYYNISIVFIPVFILILIYFMWSFSMATKIKKQHEGLVNNIETIFFIVLFTVIIYICGANESQYKFLYLFIIITTTIQSGLKKGITIAGISSFIILVMDIIMVPNAQVNPYFENDLILVGIFILTAWPLGFYVKIEGEHIKSLEEMVNIDGLTEVYNHRYFHDKLRETIMIGKRDNKPVSMIFIDIDYFKHYNDLYGHQKGDVVLKKMGLLIKENISPEYTVARYGGEEFAVILPDTLEEEATNIADDIRMKIESTYFEGEENQPKGKITASMGISVYPDKAKDDVELIKSADDALYRAKFFSKNRVEVYTSILDEIKTNIDEEDIELVTSIKTLISVINAKDRYTYGHVERVVIYSRLMAEKLKLNEKDRDTLIYGAYMHDIGKINIPQDILMKKMKLTNDEWSQLKDHPANGVEIIKPVKSLQHVIPLIIGHHERYDGKGYPNNLKGEEIPFLARVLTVVDSFDAMTSNRPYNNRKSYDEAIDELRKCEGTQFDPDIAETFIEVITSKHGIDCLEGLQ